MVTLQSRPGLVDVPKALAMACLLVVASPLAILPLPCSRFCPLAPYCPISWHLTAKSSPPAGTLLLPTGWHPTATQRLAPYCSSSWLASPLPRGSARHLPFRLVGPSSIRSSRGIALPAWLLSNGGDRGNDLPDRTSWFRWALDWSFPMSPINNPLPTGSVSGR